MEITDRSFDLSQTINYTLSIRFVPGGFCFIVFNRTDNKILYFSEITDPTDNLELLLKKTIPLNSVLQNNFEEVFCVWDTPRYTLLPASIFDRKNIAQFWKLNFEKENEMENISLLSDELRLPDIVNIYSIPTKEIDILKSFFPSIEFVCQQSIHITSSLFDNKRENNSQVFLQIHPDYFDAVVLRKGEIILANSYHFRNTDEFLYFSLNLFEQLDLDQYSTEIVLSGEVNEKDEKSVNLRKYVQSVNFKKIATDVSGLELNKLSGLERYTNIFNLPLCVS